MGSFSKQAALCGAAFTAAALGMGAAPALAQGASAEAPEITNIVVTAERREQSLQQSSASLQVLANDDLEKADLVDLKSLNQLIPGLSVSGHNAPQLFLRGVGDYYTTPMNNPAIGVNVDDVYVARPYGGQTNFYDLARVEVLKGPQGTFYGRNTIGGNINLVTNAPSLDGFEGYVIAEAGAYETADAGNYSLEGAVNMPLSRSMAARVAFSLVDKAGYLSDGIGEDQNDNESQSARVRFLYQPVDAFSLLLNADYAHLGGTGPGYVQRIGGARAHDDPFESSTSLASGQLLWNVQANLQKTLPEGYAEDPLGQLFSVGSGPTVAFPSYSDPTKVAGGNLGGWDAITGSEKFPNFRDHDYWNGSAQLDWDLGAVKLTAIPAYRYIEYAERSYPAGFRQSLPADDLAITPREDGPAEAEQISVELRVANSDPRDRLQYVAGVYSLDDKNEIEQTIYQGRIQNLFTFNDTEVQSSAAFAQGTFSVTDAFRLIAGARYTYEEVKVQGISYSGIAVGGPVNNTLPPTVVPSANFAQNGGNPVTAVFPPRPVPTVAAVRDTYPNPAVAPSQDFDKVTWRAGAEFDVTDTSMLYATASTGFKAGGYNQWSSIGRATFKPEELTAYTVGLKNQFWDRRLQANFELFNWDYQDAQVAHLSFTDQFDTNIAVDNAGEATIQGASIDVEALLGYRDRVRITTEFVDATFDEFKYIQPFSNNPTGPAPATLYYRNEFSTCATSFPNGTPSPTVDGAHYDVLIDCSGKPMARAPEWAGSASYDHTFDLAGGELNAMASVNFAAERYLSFEYTEAEKAPPYAALDFDLTYTSPRDAWALTGYVRNATNEEIYTGGGAQPFAAGLFYATIAPPRTYGVRLKYNFQ